MYDLLEQGNDHVSYGQASLHVSYVALLCMTKAYTAPLSVPSS